MPHLTRLCLLAFSMSFSSMLLFRGIHFFIFEQKQWGESLRLSLAALYGLAYIAGALASHAAAARAGERRMLALTILAQAALALGFMFTGSRTAFVLLYVAFGCCNALMWPIVESYISAGRDRAAQPRVIGWFNIAWSLGIPAAMLAMGPILHHTGPGMFAVVAAMALLTLMLLPGLPPVPVHLPTDHPDRAAAAFDHTRPRLMRSARWTMLASYVFMSFLAPIFPDIFAALGYSLIWSTAMVALIDAARLLMFIIMQRTTWWHSLAWVPAATAILLPAGFLLIAAGTSIELVLIGGGLFGLAAGVAYNAALYHAMLARHAAVEAGGGHEAMIGAGFALGPVAGLVMTALGGGALGIAVGTGPLVLACLAGGLLPLRRPKTTAPSP